MACAIEDAGFEIRDQIGWCYGSGFPKSHDVSKGIDRTAGAKRKVIASGPAVKRMIPGADQNKVGWEKNNGREYVPGERPPITDAAREWQGWGTALKPAWESIILARKPSVFWDDYHIIGSYLVRLESRLWSMLPAKTAANYFGLSQSEYDAACASAQWSVGERSSTQVASKEAMGMSRYVTAIVSSLNTVSLWKNTWAEASAPENTSTTETELSTTIDLRTLKFSLSKITPGAIMTAHRLGLWSIAHASTAERIFSATVNRLSGTLEQRALAGAIEQCAEHSRDATEISPAWEPIVLARKPLSESTIAANVLKWGTGALNIDGCRVDGEKGWPDSKQYNPGFLAGGSKKTAEYQDNSMNPSKAFGRWPANIIHDGSEEVLAGFPESGPSLGTKPGSYSQGMTKGNVNDGWRRPAHENYSDKIGGFVDSGSAARYFYTAKADSDDRLGSKHPTIKPLDLMQYLVRLVTPPKGTVLDCFSGTGTTGEAAFREGMGAVLIEREGEYPNDIRRRMGLVLGGPDERARAAIKERTKDKPVDHGAAVRS